MRALRHFAVIALLLAGTALVLSALYIPAKAALAQVLLERAWERTRNGEVNVRPWPWADINPVAVLEVPRLKERSIVLEGANGEAMAFGPGHMTNTPPIGTRGTAIVAAHRDTQFRYLRDIKDGDRIVSRPVRGGTARFAWSRRASYAPMHPGSTPTTAGPRALVSRS